MDEAAATRRAALDAVGDVEPARLRERIDHHLQTGSMVPGVLTILSVRATTDGATGGATAGDDSLLDAVERRAAGVQLIYDGLRLTRQLSHDEPWTTGGKATGDLDVLVADVLVARGFHLLARTAAATKAVETVRAFGRDQTTQRETGEPLDRNLEADALELAVIAGATLSDPGVPNGLRAFASARVAALDEDAFPAAEQFFADVTIDQLRHAASDGGTDGLTPSVDD